MKKILFVMHALGYGGAERALINLLNELPANRFEVDVLLFKQQGALMAQLPDWVRLIEAPEALRCLYGPVKKAGKYALAKVLGSLGGKVFRHSYKASMAWRWRHVYGRLIPRLNTHYDVAVAFTGVEIQYFVADCVDATRKVVFIHNDYRTAGYVAEDDVRSLGQMDHIVSISPKCVDVLKEVFPQYAARMLYLENINSSAVIRARAQESEPAEFIHDGKNILSIGRLGAQKGFDMAIDAAALLKADGMKFRWFVLGEGADRQKLEKQIAERNLTEEFVLLGVRDNPYPYIRRCDVLVQSSRYEGKSVVLDETKMLCVPIVATAYPTVADQVKDGAEGIITPMLPEGIADGVKRMLTSPELCNSVVQYLQVHEYGNQREVEKYIKLLDG